MLQNRLTVCTALSAEAEIDFVAQRINPDEHVLEPGCGYGRILVFCQN